MEKTSTSAIWNGTADTAWYEDAKTEFTISTAEQLAGLAELVNDGDEFDGKIVKLGQNIALNNTANWQSWANSPPDNEWVTIGVEEEAVFKGTFDGCDFVINGVYINNSKDCQGLFGYIESEGTIKNLGIADSYIKGIIGVGGIAYCNNGKINNSYFNGTVIGEEVVGGLVGANYHLINNSYSAGMVEGKKEVGGLAGVTIFARMDNCYSTSKVTGIKYVGELVGHNCDEDD